MRLDPKYFNLFLVCCAVVTVAVILYSTIRYHQKQAHAFRDNLETYNLKELHLPYVNRADSVRLTVFQGNPLVINFWSTWSNKSRNVHTALMEASNRYPELKILAASVRDDEQHILEYVTRHNYPFTYVEGTDFYFDLQVPGVPSLILINRSGDYFDFQVGDDPDELNMKIEALLKNEP